MSFIFGRVFCGATPFGFSKVVVPSAKLFISLHSLPELLKSGGSSAVNTTLSGALSGDHYRHGVITKRLNVNLYSIAVFVVVITKTDAMLESMKTLLISAVLAAMTTASNAQTALEAWTADRTQIFDAAGIDPADFIWIARPIVVFAQSPNDPMFDEQIGLLTERIDELALRDVIVIADTDPETPSALRTALRPRGFMLAIIGKDGRIELRKPAPWDVREISRSIDKMPLRQQEIRDRRVVE